MTSMLALAVCFMAMAPYTISTSDHDHHDIVSLAQDTDNLSTLVAAIEAAGLVDVLKGDGPFTVFAPTNEAFDALPDGTLESLLMPENRDQLVEILTYHVIPAEVMSGDLSDGMMAETVEGSEVTISLSDYGAKVNDANIASADIEASNGVVHVIDAVILPPEDNSGY
ncbi:fasciclin domain-containing protein [Rhodohalobacter halophilus]|uniref:fasciclin domain-containing protein n=1 Tax=Rhodohalobacter halophilus TaxID=1812810 RepID=UPI00083FAC29|nr:fasciclin domain-containing protein [Rhodohalobacter halophilus]